MKDHGWRGLAIGATLLAVPVGGCAVLGDDPKRTFSMPNDTGGPRLVRRCDDEFDCRSPHRGELVQPGEFLDFKLYFDEDRTYVVGDAEGKTLGCFAAPLADGSYSPDTLSDLEPCPPGTPKTSE